MGRGIKFAIFLRAENQFPFLFRQFSLQLIDCFLEGST